MTIKRLVTALVLMTGAATTSVSAAAAHIYITPDRVALRPGATQQFQVLGADRNGKPAPVSGQIKWRVDPKVGSVTQKGMLRLTAKSGLHTGALRASVGKSMTAAATIEVLTDPPQSGYLRARSWGGTAPGDLDGAQAIGVGPDGAVYVVDTVNARIQKFDSHGNYITEWNGTDSKDGQLANPCAVAVDAKGFVYVADSTSVAFRRTLRMVFSYRHV